MDLTAPHIRTSKNTKVYRYREQEFFAERGIIRVMDGRGNGDYATVTVRDFLVRAASFNAANTRHHIPDLAERRRYTRMISDMITCAKEAMTQGDPFDPKNFGQLAKKNAHVSMATITQAVPAGREYDQNLPPITDHVGQPFHGRNHSADLVPSHTRRRPEGKQLLVPGDHLFE